ncbi:MAG: hypothetical protein WCJ97_05230 [Phycisphaerae bacterium]
MQLHYWRFLAVLMMCLSLLGCCDNKGPDGRLLTDQLNDKDFSELANFIFKDIEQAKIIHGIDGAPAVVRVKPFDNKTGDPTFLMSQLVESVTSALTNSGKIAADASNDDTVYDAWLAGVKQNRKLGAPPLEEYILRGNVTRQDIEVGRDRETTYYVTFEFVNVTKLRVERTAKVHVTKITRKCAVGW